MTGLQPIWIDESDALALHDRLLALHGGAEGMRDSGLLISALARAQHMFGYDDRTDVIAMASAYTAGIVNNHPFIDGNERTGFVSAFCFSN